ncbi:hypothetical protein NIES2100_52380 [Calothrix sp. NIES-2100]|uniref:DUF4365 domain-containing protein n=1 Tax=Calothrix sp. NIES-2100 TaxID=1954172 RepID=UPI000B5DCFA3|nr:hypothetical protein NIES2100_52380 [Calothrix sp. NIES-2100]
MDNRFFDRLYKGYAAENFITGQLFENGFEAFRLPADFGIDLVVTNQFKKLYSQEIYDDSFPFGFQVKSKRLGKSDFIREVNGRNEYRFYYSLKNSEIQTLKDFSNSAYVFVFINPPGFSIKNIYAFCIHSNEIDNMIKNEFFIKNSEGYRLNVCFRTFPQQSRKSFIDEMSAKKLIDVNGIKFLEKNLPETFPRKWNASEGLYLSRKDYSKNPKDDPVDREIVRSYDFSQFPYFPKIIYS